MPSLVLLMVCIMAVSGLDLPQPEHLEVNVWDGDVMAVWRSPPNATVYANVQYTVQMAMYGIDWQDVTGCARIREPYCILTGHISDYRYAYRVRVQLILGDSVSKWAVIKKFLPNNSELQPPAFTLLATSSTLTVRVHEKPILRKLFPYGMTYTIYLEEKGNNNKAIVAYIKDGVGEEEATKTFRSLQWGRRYCVSLKVEGNGALYASDKSSEQCLLLPEQEWYIIAVSTLAFLGATGILAVMLCVLCCFLRRPEKMPAVLKSPNTGWFPLTVGEGPMEVVTDKGWFLSASKTRAENWISEEPASPQAVSQTEEWREERRTSMDSGLSIETNSVSKAREGDSGAQEDSGCGSIGSIPPPSSDDHRSAAEERHPRQGRTSSHEVRKSEDSGIGLGCQLDCSTSLDGQDGGLHKEEEEEEETVVEDNYHSQNSGQPLKQILVDPATVLVDVFTGYRAGHLPCVRTGPEESRPYRTTFTTSMNTNIDSRKEELLFSGYRRKTHVRIETMVSMDDSETSPNLPNVLFGEAFPLLTALTSLPLLDGGLSCSMDSVSVSLCDVELKNDC